MSRERKRKRLRQKHDQKLLKAADPKGLRQEPPSHIEAGDQTVSTYLRRTAGDQSNPNAFEIVVYQTPSTGSDGSLMGKG
jgi:hypothetical protein